MKRENQKYLNRYRNENDSDENIKGIDSEYMCIHMHCTSRAIILRREDRIDFEILSNCKQNTTHQKKKEAFLQARYCKECSILINLTIPLSLISSHHSSDRNITICNSIITPPTPTPTPTVTVLDEPYRHENTNPPLHLDIALIFPSTCFYPIYKHSFIPIRI